MHHLQALAQIYTTTMTPQAICQAVLGLCITFTDLNDRQRRRVEAYLHRLGDQQVRDLNTRTDAYVAQRNPEGPSRLNLRHLLFW